jgi:hypothetical protein
LSFLIDKQALWDKLDYEPHPYQAIAHQSSARFRIPCCGRRWGKSIWAGREMTYALFKPEARYWIVGPDYSLAEKEFRVVYIDITSKLKLGSKLRRSAYNVQQGNMYMELPWGTVLEAKSAHKPESLVGEGLDGVIMSEAAKHSKETWQRFIRPALADKRGWAIFPSTPEGFNYYYALYELGSNPDFPEYQSWREPSWHNHILYPGGRQDDEILAIEREVSEAFFKQEIAAEFTSFVGQIYDEFNRDLHVKQIKYNPAWKNYWTFDFGFSAPFVCLDIMVDPSDNVYVWREYQVQHLTTWEHGQILKNRTNPDQFHVDLMMGDPRGADEIATLAIMLGPMLARPVPWSNGVEAVKRHLKLQPDGKPKLFIDPSCTELIRQMESLRRAAEKEGKNPKEGQHDYDDHGPDALRYFFNEVFVLGGAGRLSDVYSAGYRGSEAETFFTLDSKITLEERVGY